MPYYDTVARNFADQVEDVMALLYERGLASRVWGVKRLEPSGVTFYFIDNERYFFRGHVYGDMDDGERFAFPVSSCRADGKG